MSNPIRAYGPVCNLRVLGLPVCVMLATAAFGFAATSAAAEEDNPWMMASATGAVSVDGKGVGSSPVTVGPGAVIETGGNGQAVLFRHGDSITVFPDSGLKILGGEDDESPGILQSLGRLLFRMESRESRDFEVRTPHLVAAIKGTTFSVDVDEDDAEVSVSEGSVLVTAARSGHSVYVGAGQRAGAGDGRGDSVRVAYEGYDEERRWGGEGRDDDGHDDDGPDDDERDSSDSSDDSSEKDDD